VNIGNAIALAVAPAGTRRVSHIDAETVGDTEARPLADQRHAKPSTETGANLVAKRHARVSRDRHRSDLQISQAPQAGGDQRRGLRLNGAGGKAVGDDE